VTLSNKTFGLNNGTAVSVKNIAGGAKVQGAITVTATNFPLTTENLAKLVEGSEITYSDAVTGAAGALVIPAGVKVAASVAGSTFAAFNAITVKGNLDVNGFAPTDEVTVDGEGILSLSGNATLVKAVNILNDGALALVETKKITLGHANAKIVGGTAYEIVPGGETAEIDGTLTAGVDDTAVVFTAAGIEGYDTTGGALVADTAGASAATLAFGAASGTGPTLTVKDATGIGGVILDVSAKGTIKVDPAKVLTLKLGAGTDKVGSGGIFTKASTAATAVKANAATQNATPGLADASVLASAKVEAKEAASIGANDIGTGSTGTVAAAGTITGAADTGTTIDKNDTFTVTTSPAIVVTEASNS
jgi:hypothetical protein